MPNDKFYGSDEWKALRRQARRTAGNKCENCGADCSKLHSGRVDHIIPRKIMPELALSPANVRLLCTKCDRARHADIARKREKPRIGIDGYPIEARVDRKYS